MQKSWSNQPVALTSAYGSIWIKYISQEIGPWESSVYNQPYQ